MQGDLGGALLGGGLGAASTIGLGGTLGKLGTAGAGATAQAIGRTGWGAQQGLGLAGNLAKQQLGANIASAAIPLAGAGLIGGVSNRLLRGPVQGGANRAMGAGSGIIGYNAVTGEPIMAAGAAVPPSVTFIETSLPPTSVTLSALLGLITPTSKEWAASSPSVLIIPICLTNLIAIIHS